MVLTPNSLNYPGKIPFKWTTASNSSTIFFLEMTKMTANMTKHLKPHQPPAWFFCYFVSTGVALRQYLPCHPYAAKKRSRPTLWRELWRPCRILQFLFLSRWWFQIRFYCYPYILGEIIQFDGHICLRWVVQPVQLSLCLGFTYRYSHFFAWDLMQGFQPPIMA